MYPPYIVKNFTKGVISRVEDESLPKGAASSSLNWLTKGDRIELCRGQQPMGTTNSGTGKITGLIVGRKVGGEQVSIMSYSRKIKYYDDVTQDWVETVPTNIISSEADGEDISFSQYDSLAGSMVYGSSPSGSIYKIMTANPGNAIDMGMNNHRGYIQIKQSRMRLWNRKDTNGGSDLTGLYGSYIDKDELSDYTSVSAESVGTGNGSTTAYSGTLSMQKTLKTIASVDTATNFITSTAHGFDNGDPIKFTTTGTLPAGLELNRLYFVTNKTVDTFNVSLKYGGVIVDITDSGTGTHTAVKGVRRTVMYVTITDSVETFQDSRQGTLIGNRGGTGTINYATGEYSVTFATAPANTQAITASYYWEDSFVEGVCDFSKDTPRTAGQGYVLRQDDAGDMRNIGAIGNDDYCFHTLKTYKVTLATDDTDATNLVYRSKVGISNHRGLYETGEGIYYADDSDISDPFIRLLKLFTGTAEVVPDSISDNIDLSSYRFDKVAIRKWGLYIVVACRTTDSTINNRLLLYHTIWKSWDVTDFRASCLEEYGGNLIAGDSGSNNVFTLFNSFANEDSNIDNYWISGDSNLDIEGTKMFTRFVMRGLISADQTIRISFSYDNGPWVEMFMIEGNGSYVDQGSTVRIGSQMIGTEEIGGSGGSGDESINASPYAREVIVNTSRFEKYKIKVEALKIGYVSISEYQAKDIRYKGRKLPVQYQG